MANAQMAHMRGKQNPSVHMLPYPASYRALHRSRAQYACEVAEERLPIDQDASPLFCTLGIFPVAEAVARIVVTLSRSYGQRCTMSIIQSCVGGDHRVTLGTWAHAGAHM